MDETRKQQVQRTFHEALERPVSERTAFLEEACGGDEYLRSSVERLLAAHEKAGGFLRESEGDLGHRALADAVSVRRAEERAGLTVPIDPGVRVGSRIGPYQLLEEIGAGGFGTVYRAEQAQPVRREVALKVIKLGMDTKRVVARFEAERQALAMMDHPGIATVLDAGVTPVDPLGRGGGGRPYFVMELVRGVRITKYCDSEQLSVPQRLELFVEVCRALQHAHQKGIIHRDVKPSNVLVTVPDGRPVPKVIDFGIAKATGVRLTPDSVSTELGQIIGTPEYMSPEQADLSTSDIDTRSDIYSLGVLLYELLTGTTPFSGERLGNRSYGKIQRVIGEEEPQTPSTRLSSMRKEDATAIAQNRKVEPRTLAKLVHGELDWIVMKALEKDRTRRYETAAGLALDVKRYLGDEAVEAGPPSRLYRLRKFVRRYRTATIAGALIAASLLVGLGLATYGLFHAKKESQRARENEAQATQEAEKANKVVDLLRSMFRAADPCATRGSDYTVREALDEFTRRLGDQLSDEPAVEAELRETMGFAYRGLGRHEEAVTHLKRAVEIRRRLLGEEHPRTLQDMNALGVSYLGMGRHTDAEPLLAQTLAVQRKVVGEGHRDTLCTMNHLASVYGATGRPEQAERLTQNALRVSRSVFGDESDASLESMNSLGHLYWSQRRFVDAEPLFAKSLEALRRTLGKEHPLTLTAMNNLASVYRGMQRHAEAEQLFKETLETQRRLLGEGHPHRLETLENLAGLYHESGRHSDEEPLFRDMIEIRTRTLGEEHSATLSSRNKLGTVYTKLGRFDEAERLLERTLEVARRVLGEEDRLTLNCTHNVAEVYQSTGRLAEAEELYVRTLEAKRRVLGEEDNDTVSTAINLGNLYSSQGRFTKAEPLVVKALEIRRRVLGEEHPETLVAANNLASLHTARARYREAEHLHVETLRIRSRVLGEEHPATLTSRSNLGVVYWKQRQFAAAEPHFEKTLELRRRVLGREHAQTIGSMHNLASLYEETGRKAAAEKLYREVLEIQQRTRGEENELTLETMNSLGLLCLRSRRLEEAGSPLENALRIRRRVLGEEHPKTLASKNNLASLYEAQSRYPEAADLYADALKSLRRVLGEEHPHTLATMNNLGKLYVNMGQGHLPKAERLLLEAHQTRGRVLGAQHPETLNSGTLLALLYRKTGRYAEAEPLVREGLEAGKKEVGEGHWALHVIRSVLGECLAEQGRFEEAEPLLVKACNALDGSEAPAARRREALQRIVKLYEAWGKTKQAEKWRAKLGEADSSAGTAGAR